MYWGEVGWRTEAVADTIRFKRLPNMHVTPGRVPPRKDEFGDSSASQPMNTAALAASQSGWESGTLWDPKDSIMRNIPTPNLDTNERARDAELNKNKTLAQGLFYDVKHHLTEKRVPAAVIYKGALGGEPSLCDTNKRARDAEINKKTLAQDPFFYDVVHNLTEKRVPAAVIYKGDFAGDLMPQDLFNDVKHDLTEKRVP
eukprot:CAMPEP_0206266238 /NCGR_PEP_ID=MMETSP0047_2-20121206/30458_1 /ASSEMBLY_ACC=CAM_ASM_000192 /TAXON_ID=195065 /ORGANISM="Chroomonas mesostigmatica_cf, Strain CCMP1168" /LENGTH=199 /DNA_ID=CAMNT_0053694259 /DNA_START=17 /DNA_END=618 /DNA_ORIENTATION=+